MQRVAIKYTGERHGPARTIVMPGGVTQTNGGHLFGTAQGFAIAMVTPDEADVLTNLGAPAKDINGGSIMDARGKALTNRDFVTVEPGSKPLPVTDTFELVVAASAEKPAKAPAKAPAKKSED